MASKSFSIFGSFCINNHIEWNDFLFNMAFHPRFGRKF